MRTDKTPGRSVSSDGLLTNLLNIRWILILRGIIPIVAGAFMLSWPYGPSRPYVLLFGAYVFLDGLLLIYQTAIMGKEDPKRWSRLLHGAIGVAVGVAILLLPELSHVRLASVFSGYMIVTGLIQATTAFKIRNSAEYEGLVVVSGLMSIAIGGLLMTRPFNSLSSLVRVIGLFLIVYGLLVAAFAYRIMRPSEDAL